MKFLAILKDSFREALDTKVFYVMIGLSALLTLVAATLSFQPRSPTDIMQKLMTVPLYGDLDQLKQLNPERLMHMAIDPRFKTYEVVGVVPQDDAPEGPDSPHVVTLAAHCRSPVEAKQLRDAPQETMDLIRQRFGTLVIPGESGTVEKFEMLRVTDVRPARPDNALVPEKPEAKDVYFEVVTGPTAVTRRLWPFEPSLFFGALPLTFLREVPLGFQLFLLEDQIINGIGAWVTILISIVITAFFIPNMLRKGTVDLLLVKPIHRTTLLLYKYVGGLLFIFLNTVFVVVGVWLAISLRSGIWAPGFLLTIFVITSFFAILYAASTLFAVLTRSPVAAILLTCAVWFVVWVVGVTYAFGETLRQQKERSDAAAERTERGEDQVRAQADPQQQDRRGRRFDPDREPPFNPDNLFFRTVRGIHYVLPRAKDLDYLMTRVLQRDLLTANQIRTQKLDDKRIDWGESLTVSGIFVGLMLGLACLRFATKDY
jgi:ABC-type transport system involved in multi-copper enzyme maturation permease subunit